MMTREESVLPREAYDALECKRTLHFNQGQPEDEETDDNDVDIMVWTTATGTQDTTERQENTQLDETNHTSSKTAPIPNVRHSPFIPLGRRKKPIVINDNDIICGICNNNIVHDIDMGHIISDVCRCNLNYHYNCLLTMRNYIKTTSMKHLIKNGNFSSGKEKNVKAKFFFIKDRIDDGEIKVINCPAEEMWADILTKPLHGMAFHTMRACLINCPINYEEADNQATKQITKKHVVTKRLVTWGGTKQVALRTPQECVGQNRSNKPSAGTDS
jgi:hypothetical protein